MTPNTDDLVDRIFQIVDDLIAGYRRRVIGPLTTVARGIAFAAIVVSLLLTAVVALLIGVVRFLDVYLFAGHTYWTYLSLGLLFCLIGLIIWRLGRPRKRKSS